MMASLSEKRWTQISILYTMQRQEFVPKCKLGCNIVGFERKARSVNIDGTAFRFLEFQSF
jgi:hypothetical protein